MQEIPIGKRDVDAFLNKLDDAWDSLRKAGRARPSPADRLMRTQRGLLDSGAPGDIIGFA